MSAYTARDALIDLEALAVELGWTTSPRRDKAPLLHAPPPHHRVTVVLPPHTQARDATLRTLTRKVIKYADPLKRAVVANRYGLDAQMKNVDLATITAPVAPRKRQTRHPAVPVTVTHVTSPAVAASPPAAPVVVREQPWLAHQGLGTRGVGLSYASATTIQRHWSDGHVDYRCAAVSCEYTHDKPRSVAKHYGSTRDDAHPALGKPTRAELRTDPQYVEPGYHREVPARVDRLRRELQRALAQIWADVETRRYSRDDLATRLAEVLIELRGERAGDDERDPSVPLTAEQLLERVRHLVDDGSYLRVQRRHDELSDQVAKLENELLEARDVAQRATERWGALRAIVDAEE